jgi:hypothetical protein
MTLGANVGSLGQAANRFTEGANRTTGPVGPLLRSANGLSSRFASSHNEIDHAVRLLQGHASVLNSFAHILHVEAGDQQRISGDRSNLGHAGPFGVIGSGSALGGLFAAGKRPILRGVPRSVKPMKNLGPLLRGVPRFSLGSGAKRPYNQALADWADTSLGRAQSGRTVIEMSQSMVRAFRKAPHSPRTITGFTKLLKLKPAEIVKRFKTESVGATTKAKYFKNAKGAGLSLLSSFAVTALTRGDEQNAAKVFGQGLEHGLNIASSLSDVRKLSGLTKLTRPLSVASKVSGGFAILGGVLGIVDTANRYNAGVISGKRAVGEGLLNGASIAGGVMMFTPAAPIGAVLIAGAAVVQAGLWVYDNRRQITAYAKTAARVVAKVQTAAVKAVVTQVAKAFPAPVKKMAAQIASGAKKTLSRFFGRK